MIYYTQNNIGSTTLLTNKDGSDVGQFLYSPFGEMWVEEASEVDISHITRFFTNQQYDKESGLYYYNARYYDPHLGSFITPDPAFDQLNHYSYCSGNPIKFTDPTGLRQNTIFSLERQILGEGCGGSGGGGGGAVAGGSFLGVIWALYLSIIGEVNEQTIHYVDLTYIDKDGNRVKERVTEEEANKRWKEQKDSYDNKTKEELGKKQDPSIPNNPPDKDKKGDIYYRGLSKQDLEDLKSGAIKSNALRNGLDPQKIIDNTSKEKLGKEHAEGSGKSPFISVTKSRELAQYYAKNGPPELRGNKVITIKTDRAIPNFYNNKPQDKGNEYLVPISIPTTEIIDEEDVK